MLHVRENPIFGGVILLKNLDEDLLYKEANKFVCLKLHLVSLGLIP